MATEDSKKEPIEQLENVISIDADKKGHTNYDRVDAEVAKYAGETKVEVDEETSKRLKRMIDKRVLTIMIFTYFLQALDKGTMSFASIMDIVDDLHLKGQEYSWLTTCIYLAVLTVEYPTNWIIQRVPIAKYLGCMIILWGATLALHAACTNFAGIVTVRTFLGAFEACCQPIFVVLSSMWYKREEQASTVSYWYMMNGAQQIVGGLLATAFTAIPASSPIHPWQALFMTYGILSVFWGIFVLWYMPDSPMRAKCFSEEDKKLMVERLRANQTGIQNKRFRKEQLIEALLDPQTWCLALISMLTTLPTSGLGAYANIVIKSFNFTNLQTQLLAMVLGFYIIIVLLGSSWIVKKTGQNLLVMIASIIPSIVGTVLLITLENNGVRSRQIGLLICYYMVLSFWACQTLDLSLISRNIAGQTKKTVVVAANFVFWAAGNAIGPQVFLSWDSPRYIRAWIVHLVCYILVILVCVFLRWWYARQNNLRDRRANKDEELKHSFEDLTDRENLNFRYMY